MPLDPSLGAAVRLQIEATGEDVADRLRAQFEALKTTVALAQQTFASGESMYRDYAKQLREVGTEMSRLRGIADAAGVEIEGLGTKGERAAQRAAAAAERAADREAAAAQKAAQKIIEESQRRREAHEREAAERIAAAEKAEIAEAEMMARAAERHERMMAQGARATDQLAAGADKAKKGMGNLNFAILNVGYAVQDATSAGDDWARGIAATLNNVPLLVMGVTQAMGASASAAMAWAGGLQIVAAGGMVLYQNWSKIMAAFGLEAEKATVGVERLQERIKELESKKVKLSVDDFELEQARKRMEALQAAQAAFERMGKGRTTFEQQAGAAAQEAIDESKTGALGLQEKLGQQEIRRTLRDSVQLREISEALDTQRKRAAEFAEQGGERAARERLIARQEIERLEKLAPKVREELIGQARREIGGLFAGVTSGQEPLAAEARRGLVERLRGVGEEGVAFGIEQATPAEMRAKQQEKDFIENQQRLQRLDKDLKAERQRLETAQEQAERMAEAAKPESMSPVADMAAQVADQKAAAAAKLRGVGEAADERAIAAGVRQFGGALGKAKGPGSLAAAAEARAEAGQALAETIRDLQGQVVGAIKRMGGDQNVEAIANRVAEEAAMAAQAKVGAGGRRGQFEAGFLAAGAPPELAAAGAGRMEAGMRGGLSPEAALAQANRFVQQVMMRNLRQQAVIEQFHGMFGEASMQLAQMQGQMGGMVNQRPNPLPMFPGN